MKNIFVLLAIVFLLTASCSKFLEESSQDLIRPQTVEHYRELLRGEGYFKNINNTGWFIDIMTDNIHCLDMKTPTTAVNSTDQNARHAYQWARDLEDPTGTFKDRFFQDVYRNILAANSCLEGSAIAEGTDLEKNALIGEAYFVRAYGYFLLANTYAQAYNMAKDEDLSVPLLLESKPTLNGFPRSTKKEVWSKIVSDIEKSMENLSKVSVSKNAYEINYKAALLLASRIYLFMEDYDNAIKYGEKFMDLHPTLRNISNYTGRPNTMGTNRVEKSFLHLPSNPEVVFAFSTSSNYASNGSHLFYANQTAGRANLNYGMSFGFPGSLHSMYTTNDKRRTTWFADPLGVVGMFLATPYYHVMKVNNLDGCNSTHHMRSGEVYLTLAEAYARKSIPDQENAVKYLNLLRKNRINNYADMTLASFENAQTLISFIWDERRRELCFEEHHRWWDLKRIGQPRLEHKYLDKVFVLEEKDAGYVLNFPKAEILYNSELKINVRPDRQPQ